MAGMAHFDWADPFFLDAQLDDDERMIRDTARAYAQDRLAPRVISAWSNEETDPDIFREMGAQGLLGPTVSEDYGGVGASYVAYGLIAREIERKVGARRPLITSPLRRCRETSLPLARLWSSDPVIDARVGEIPSPMHDLEARGKWLRAFMAGSWTNDGTGVDFLAWRDGVVEALLGLKQDTVIFSHFIAINVAAGRALADDRVVCFRPDNCSVTVFDTKGGKLALVEQGREAETKVN